MRPVMCRTSYKKSRGLARANRNLPRYPSRAAPGPLEEAFMRSLRIQMGIIPAVAALLMAACGSAPSSGGAAVSNGAGLVPNNPQEVGGQTGNVLENAQEL